MKIPEVKGGQFMTVLYGIAILVILFVVYQVLAKIGLIKTRAKKKAEAAKEEASTELRTSEFFDPMILEQYPNYVPLKNQARDWAAQLYNAMHKLGTDEEAIYSVFGRLRNKLNIAEISLNYRLAWRRDLLTEILNELTEKEQVNLWTIISKLPNK